MHGIIHKRVSDFPWWPCRWSDGLDGTLARWNQIPGYGRYDRKRGATLLADGRRLIYRVDGVEPYTLDPAELRAWLQSLERIMLGSAAPTSTHLH